MELSFRIVSNRMKFYRSMHAAVCLNGGKICIIGGENFSGLLIKGCEIFDPVTESFSDAPYGLEQPMKCVSACLLQVEDMMLVCGQRSDGKSYCEKYSPTQFISSNCTATFGNVNACSFIGNNRVLMVCGATKISNETCLYEHFSQKMSCGAYLNVRRNKAFLADCGNGKIAVGGTSNDIDSLCLVEVVDASSDPCPATFTDGQIMLKNRYGAAASKY